MLMPFETAGRVGSLSTTPRSDYGTRSCTGPARALAAQLRTLLRMRAVSRALEKEIEDGRRSSTSRIGRSHSAVCARYSTRYGSRRGAPPRRWPPDAADAGILRRTQEVR